MAPQIVAVPGGLPAEPAAPEAGAAQAPSTLAAALADAAGSAPRSQPGAAPLRLDAGTYRRANEASQSAVQRMAEASGRPLEAEPISGPQRQAAAIASSVKPDCLGPDAGGSLLSIPRLAWWAVAGKCR